MAPTKSFSPATTSSSSTSGKVTVAVESARCQVKDNSLFSTYTYENAVVEKKEDGTLKVKPTSTDYEFKLDLSVPKTGLLLIGLGGNNGTTLAASIFANRQKMKFDTKQGEIEANYYGSVTQSSTIKLGVDADGHDVYAPFNEVVPFVHPNDLVVGGWDINDANLKEAAQRAQVLEVSLQQKLSKQMESIVPMPSIYYPDFIAANQTERANNLINPKGSAIENDKWAHVEKIRKDIKEFKSKNCLDKVVVLWTANTERFSGLIDGVNDTAENLIKAVKQSHEEVSPSTIFAIACILDNIPYINGSPQNTFVPGCIELAEKNNSFIGGDDFKSGQTKMKSVLAQFLVDAGIRPISIASYNHLGNNDGYNLSAPQQFRSKEISKASVVDDIIASNQLLYNDKLGKKIDHCIVIKYVQAAGDSKVAMDEYYSELMLGGHNRISISNVCEDSLLATPLIIDLVVMTEFLSRVSYKKKGVQDTEFEPLHSVLSFLSYWLKAPLTRPGYTAINGLNKQRTALENFLRLLIGLPSLNELRFEERLH
ncbi:myo-inositol-1-phosphate synthase [Nadsonia fulvescens var. elongata DSM 6958]|uniref:Inositol-3-phosphate synthase n=1 Tax=Nadsonia fulvescens var. elongata DSM 6958 TaxID=857566 RepID=A0A1E3PPX7_9ASCO|nr:myo-inositol-1-phosphate synthase [Nadsonia fulvescens var. elongata DSM 6958]